MKKIMNIILGMTLALTLILSGVPSVHASSLEDGNYTAEVVMYQETKDEASICDSLFAHHADIKVTGDNAVVTLYVASPIPSFADASETAVAEKGGVLSDVVLMEQYNGVVTTSTVVSEREVKYFSKVGAMFGINIGDELPSDVITVTLPKSVLNGDLIEMSASVNVVMNGTQNFRLSLSNYTLVSSNDDSTDVVPPVTTETQSSTVTATVPVNETTFTVEVPTSIGFGELSYSQDTSVSYDVTVSAIAGNDGKQIKVTASESGSLTNVDGSSTLPFTNKFATQTFSGNETVTSSLVVSANDAKSVEAGAYSGTITFEISTVE